MLVLSRHEGQEIIITCGDQVIVVTVTELLDGRVKLGFDAHESVRIARREIYREPAPRMPERSDLNRRG